MNKIFKDYLIGMFDRTEYKNFESGNLDVYEFNRKEQFEYSKWHAQSSINQINSNSILKLIAIWLIDLIIYKEGKI